MTVENVREREASATDQELREELRKQLEETRELFLELARLVSADDWNRRSGNPAWSLGQILGHIVLIFQAIPWKMGRLRKGKGAPKPPDFLFNPLNVLSTRLGTRKFNRENILSEYDRAHDAALETLNDISEHEWKLTARFFGVEQDSAELFRYHASHVREHEQDVRSGVK